MAGHKKSLRGRLLLDGGNLQGSFFHRAVVLVCQHDSEGAFGLVLNRPSSTSVGDALTGDLPETLKVAPLFVGGPVQPAALSYLHFKDSLRPGSVMTGIELGHSPDELMELAGTGGLNHRVLIFAGYSGWSPGQLDEEISRGAWLIEDATADLIFDPEPISLWRRILRGRGGLLRLLAEAPDDLEWN